MTIRHLPDLHPAPAGKPDLGQVSGLQELAAQIAAGQAWTPQLAALVTATFDEQAADWNATHSVGRFDPLHDALARGGIGAGGLCAELGSGTGQLTPALSAHFDHVACLDLSPVMLAHAPSGPGRRVRADASRLPLRDGRVDAAVLVDAFCFARETERILAPDGVMVWINLLGADGPLYVPTERILTALPGTWGAIESTAGWGSWAVLRRSR
ncbi:class I SAM-dependent methyltransferase [Nonomuraea endophytica]|uniref:class I SAM-dependent methyltransferase n=1 Tax=Nonomuraea endophytica TaxID=714136 RepID=UPI0037C80BBB